MASPKIGSNHTRAVHLAVNTIDSVIKAMDGEGHFMGKEQSPRTQARLARIEKAPPEVKALLDQGFSRQFVERLARLEDE